MKPDYEFLNGRFLIGSRTILSLYDSSESIHTRSPRRSGSFHTAASITETV